MKEWQKILAKYEIPEDNWEVQELKKMLSDHGSYLPLFFWFHAELNSSFLELSDLFNKIQTNKDILRNCAINPIEAYKPKLNAAKQYEILNDLIDLALIEHQQEKLAKSFVSSKHMHLLNSENIQMIWTLFKDNDLTRDQLNDLAFKKISSFKNVKDYTLYLKTLIKKFASSWNVNAIINKVSNTAGAAVVYSDNTTVIAEIFNFTASSALGSGHWCIARNTGSWNSYVNGFNRQYFIWETSLLPTDNLSTIGVTIGTDVSNYQPTIVAAHDQFDRNLRYSGHELNNYMKHLKCYSKEKIASVMFEKLNNLRKSNSDTDVGSIVRFVIANNLLKKLNKEQVNIIFEYCITKGSYEYSELAKRLLKNEDINLDIDLLRKAIQSNSNLCIDIANQVELLENNAADIFYFSLRNNLNFACALIGTYAYSKILRKPKIMNSILDHILTGNSSKYGAQYIYHDVYSSYGSNKASMLANYITAYRKLSDEQIKKLINFVISIDPEEYRSISNLINTMNSHKMLTTKIRSQIDRQIFKYKEKYGRF